MIQLWIGIVLFLPAVSGESGATAGGDLPSWITESDGFKNPTEMDLIKIGSGSIEATGKGSRGWLVYLNQKAGHGAEIQVEKLSLNPDSNDFFIITTWPLDIGFKQIQLLTGNFEKPLKKIRIPNTSTLFFLYQAAETTKTPTVALTFRRYGVSLQPEQPPTENPGKNKEIVYEVQLKGKAPEDYTSLEFLSKVKEGIRDAARRYAAAHNIAFYPHIPTEEMVSIHKISFCPFEWPERDICASIKHSVFVSGHRVPDDTIILDYQLTADHLKVMWSEDSFPELEELGIKVFQLPSISGTVGYWILIISLVIISSLIISCIVWKAYKTDDTSSEENFTEAAVKVIKRTKFKLSKHQRVPSFIYANPNDPQINKYKESAVRSTITEEISDNISNPQLPFKNYAGVFLFGNNRAFEEDEEKEFVTPPKSTTA